MPHQTLPPTTDPPPVADSTIGHVCEWLDAVRRRLDVIRDMPEAWDHAGAARPSPMAVDQADRLLTRLAPVLEDVPEPLVGATRGGTVQIEWEDEPRYFKAEVSGDGTVGLLFQDVGVDREWTVPLDGPLDDLVEHVRRVCG